MDPLHLHPPPYQFSILVQTLSPGSRNQLILRQGYQNTLVHISTCLVTGRNFESVGIAQPGSSNPDPWHGKNSRNLLESEHRAEEVATARITISLEHRQGPALF